MTTRRPAPSPPLAASPEPPVGGQAGGGPGLVYSFKAYGRPAKTAASRSRHTDWRRPFDHPGVCMEPNQAENLADTIQFDERLRARQTETAASAGDSSPIGPGSKVGPYQVGELVGEGGMGLVYRATDTILDRTVALKVLPPYLTQNPDLLHRIRTETHAQARLQHPNIVTLYSVMEVPAGFILVMEFVEGQTLRQRILEDGPLSAREAVRIFEQAIHGIAYAHEQGIVHRDLKPDNIFLTRRGEVKIMDFGVAKIVDSREPTRTRSLVGTLLYIAPEQINGRDADFRSDVYTLGIGLFEAVTGRLPFERRSDYALMHAHVLEKPPRPRGYRRNLPPELESVILKAIEKEPDRRFQTMQEFRLALLDESDRHGLADGSVAESTTDAERHARRQRAGDRRNRIFGGWYTDVALVAVAGLLALFLGIVPGTVPPADDVEPATRLQAPVKPGSRAAHRDSAAPPNRSAGRNEAARPPSRQAGPNRDKRYDNLRRAWGG